MVWSLSKDDDGLDGISSPESSPTPLSVNSPGRPIGDPSAATASTGSPSIVVDPSAQLPVQDELGSPRARRSLEPTLVLKTRRLDELREEVKKQNISHSRGMLKGLLLWAVAGGVALWMGVLAARTALGPTNSDEGTESILESGRLIPTVSSADRRQERESQPGASPRETGSERPATDRPHSQVGAKNGSAAQEPSPSELGAAPEADANKRPKKWLTAPWTEPKKAEPKRKYSPHGLDPDSQPSSGETLTLDDLPSE